MTKCLTDNGVAVLEGGKVRPLADIRRDVVATALEANGGDKRATAKQLGIALKTLYNWLNEWGVI